MLNPLNFEIAERVVKEMRYFASTNAQYRKPKAWDDLTEGEKHLTTYFVRECYYTSKPGYNYAHSKLMMFFDDEFDHEDGPVKYMECKMKPFDKLPVIAKDWYREFNKCIDGAVKTSYNVAQSKLLFNTRNHPN